VNKGTESFVIRIWDETVGKGEHEASWRGSIERVGSGKRLYFCDLNAIVRFLQEELGLEARASRGWWRGFSLRGGHARE
jgi:hypothetical protein